MGCGGKRIWAENYLPSELCYKIFLKLPLRSLLRFRCVCKTWRTVIDDPDFIYAHLTFCKNTSSSIDYHNSRFVAVSSSQEAIVYVFNRDAYAFKASEKIPNLFLPPPPFTLLCGHIDGVLSFSTLSAREGYRIILWNPSIRKSLKLPPLPHKDMNYRPVILMGYDRINDDYKVVVISHNNPELIQVYALKTGYWRSNHTSLQGHNDFINLPTSEGVVYSKGVAYWLSSSGDIMTSFNFVIETIDHTELPAYGGIGAPLNMLFLRGGDSLAIFRMSNQGCSIWVIVDKDDGTSTTMEEVWSHKHDSGETASYRVHLFYSEFWHGIRLLYVDEDRHKILFKGFWGLRCYDMVSHEMTGLFPGLDDHYSYIVPYVESLLLHKLVLDDIP